MDIDHLRCLVVAIAEHSTSPVRQALVAQAASISSAEGSVTMVEFTVDPVTPFADIVNGPLDVTPAVIGPTGEPEGELLLWLTGGRLTTLEQPWWTADPPTELPRLDRLTFA